MAAAEIDKKTVAPYLVIKYFNVLFPTVADARSVVVSVIRPHSLNPFFGSGAFRHQRGVLNIYLPFCYYHEQSFNLYINRY